MLIKTTCSHFANVLDLGLIWCRYIKKSDLYELINYTKNILLRLVITEYLVIFSYLSIILYLFFSLPTEALLGLYVHCTQMSSGADGICGIRTTFVHRNRYDTTAPRRRRTAAAVPHRSQ